MSLILRIISLIFRVRVLASGNPRRIASYAVRRQMHRQVRRLK